MKYSANHYARAFAELTFDTKDARAQGALVLNFWSAVERNGDLSKAPKIVAQAEKLLRRADGHDLYEVETARKTKLPANEILAGIAKPNDIIRETIKPALIAGVRITRNEGEQLDASLATRLQKLFA